MGHAGQVADHGVAGDIRSDRERQQGLVVLERRCLDDLPERHQAGCLVGDLDPQRRLTRNRRLDADRGGERERQVVLQCSDLPHGNAVARLQLVLRNRRTGVDTDDGRLDVEARQGRLDQLDVRLDLVVQPFLPDGDGIQQAQVRLHPDPLDLIFYQGRCRLVAARNDRQHGLGDSRGLPASKGRWLIFDWLLQRRCRGFEVGRWRRGGRGGGGGGGAGPGGGGGGGRGGLSPPPA